MENSYFSHLTFLDFTIEYFEYLKVDVLSFHIYNNKLYLLFQLILNFIYFQ